MPEVDTYGFGEMAQGLEHGFDHRARYAGDEKLWVQFHMLPMMDEAKSAEEGRPIFKDVAHVRIMQPGNKESIVDRPVTDMDKARFARQYENWKAGNKEILEGTPLDQWPQVTAAQVEELKFFHVRTVEQLADIADVHAQKFMGINLLKRKAKEYLDRAGAEAASSQLTRELERKDNQIQALQAAMKDLTAKISDLESTVEVASKRGRRKPTTVPAA